MVWIPSAQEFATHCGLPAAALAPDAREIDRIHVAANLFELRSHGLSGASVRFSVRDGSRLAIGLSATSWATVAETNDPDFFAVSGFTLSDEGRGSLWVVENVTPKIVAILRAWSSYVQARAIAYAPPWDVAPDWAPMIVSQLAAPVVASALRISTARYPVEEVRERAKVAQEFVDKELARGVPMRDGVGPIDATASIPDNAPKAGNAGGSAAPWITGAM